MTKGMAILQARKLWPKERVRVAVVRGEYRVGYVHDVGRPGEPGSLWMFMMIGTGDSWQAAVDAAKAEIKRIEEFDYGTA